MPAIDTTGFYPHTTPAAKAAAEHIHWQFTQLAQARLAQMSQDTNASAARFDAPFDSITVEDVDRICVS